MSRKNLRIGWGACGSENMRFLLAFVWLTLLFLIYFSNIFENSVAVDITFESINVSVTDAHVHMGAVDAKGQPWFVYDVTSLRRNPPPFNSSGVNATATCEEDDLYPTTENLQILPPYPTERPPIRLLCTIYSVEPYHEPKISAMRETWAPKCDGFFVASNKTDPSYDAVNLLRRGPDSYDNMWQKVQAIVSCNLRYVAIFQRCLTVVFLLYYSGDTFTTISTTILTGSTWVVTICGSS